MPSTAVTRKRVVLHHSSGPLKGLHQIIGLLEGTQAAVAKDAPVSLTYGQGKQASHTKTVPRYIEYREYALKRAGRLNDFHPEQR